MKSEFFKPFVFQSETLGDTKVCNFGSMDRTLKCDHSVESC